MASSAVNLDSSSSIISDADNDDDNYNKRFVDNTQITYGSNISSQNQIDEMGSRSSLNRNNEQNDDLITNDWEMNYHEAAIFLEEGENNEKFDSHPRHPSALPAYLLVHNSWYYGLDVTFSILLLLLALTEQPSVDSIELPIYIHSILELLSLSVISIELMLKLRWIGWLTILKHKRTMLKCLTLLIMLFEVVIVILRQSTHFRITRALRPIFLIDTKVCGGVRRFIRQILQSLPPILDMLILLLFIVSTYSLLGYFLFSSHKNNLYFQTLHDSFISMFVLLTTANFPDVMMPAYALSKWYSIFFISYISIVLYVFMNLMLAVVYETFTTIEKEKFRKLLLHKRQACQLAFRLLISKQQPNYVRFKQFHGLIRYYSPKTSQRDVVLIFRQLNQSNNGLLTLDEFYHIYDIITLKWYLKDLPDHQWYKLKWPPLTLLLRFIKSTVTWEYFEYIVYMLIIGNGLAMFIRIMESSVSLEEGAKNFCASWDTYLFFSLFLIEALMKIITYGWDRYISSGWNFFDLLITICGLFGSLLLLILPKLTFIVIIRPMRLLRLFKLKKRYRDIFGTLVLLLPLMWSTGIVMMVLYYFFAIIGMELFSKYDLRNCCKNTTVEDFYYYNNINSNNNSNSGIGYYYLNNFDNLLISGITLFELTVVNNWFIVMNAYASVVNSFTRIYFMLFYLFTMIVLTIVVASVLEAFRFRIQYKKQTSKHDEERMLHEEVIVDWTLLQRQIQNVALLENLQTHFVRNGVCYYIGRRQRTRDVLQHHMYHTEIKQWLDDYDKDNNHLYNNINDILIEQNNENNYSNNSRLI